MKRKIFSILFALVLVMSFSLIPAVPAMAVILETTTTLTVPDNVYRPAEFVASSTTINSGTAYTNVRFNITVDGPVDFTGDRADTFTITKVNGSSDTQGINETFVLEDGDWVGYWGPADGFTLSDGYNETSTFTTQMCNVTTAPLGNYDVTVELVNLTPDPDVILATATDSFSLSADTLYVGAGQQFTTIQSAIDAASAGDTINVAAGTYTEDLAIDGKDLTLVGAGSGADPGSNTILGKIGTYASNLEVENATSLTVSGFRFTGGMWGIQAYDDPITVNIHDNVFAFHNQSGVRVGSGQSGSLVQNNEFIGCGGVEFWNSTGGTISGNNVSNDGVGIFLMGCDGTTVSGNEVTVFGRGLRINSPPGISGDYPAGYALFGPLSWADVTGAVVYAEPAEGCDAITNPDEINGNIALIDRGTCSFSVKVKNAQDAGAIGVIIANNKDELVNMAGDDASITIPAISIKQSDGDAIEAELATGVNATLSSTSYGAVIVDEGIHIQSCNNITVTGNTVSKFTNGEVSGYNHGKAGAGIGITGGCDTLTIENNNLLDNSVAVYIGTTFASSSPTNVKINENNIKDNADYGVLNITYPENGSWNMWDYHLFGAADATVDAKYNYWGADLSGPYHATNPNGTGDAVSDNVNYRPWLYFTSVANGGDTIAHILANQVPAYAQSVDLGAGWNTFSVPIGLDGQYNTWAELYTLTSLDYSLAYRFDSSSQTFQGLATNSTYAIAPGEGFYIKMDSAGSIPYCYSTQFTIPSRDLKAGWNLIGGGMDTRPEVDSCVSIATTGSTAGYTHIISPPENASSWVYIAEASTAHYFAPGEGYWVFMAGDRTLGLFDLTPVAWVGP